MKLHQIMAIMATFGSEENKRKEEFRLHKITHVNILQNQIFLSVNFKMLFLIFQLFPLENED